MESSPKGSVSLSDVLLGSLCVCVCGVRWLCAVTDCPRGDGSTRSFYVCIFKALLPGTHHFKQNPWEHVGFGAGTRSREENALLNEADTGSVLTRGAQMTLLCLSFFIFRTQTMSALQRRRETTSVSARIRSLIPRRAPGRS